MRRARLGSQLARAAGTVSVEGIAAVVEFFKTGGGSVVTADSLGAGEIEELARCASCFRFGCGGEQFHLLTRRQLEEIAAVQPK